jgi:hypothetical protein
LLLAMPRQSITPMNPSGFLVGGGLAAVVLTDGTSN